MSCAEAWRDRCRARPAAARTIPCGRRSSVRSGASAPSRSACLYPMIIAPGRTPRDARPAESRPNHAVKFRGALTRAVSRGTNTPRSGSGAAPSGARSKYSSATSPFPRRRDRAADDLQRHAAVRQDAIEREADLVHVRDERDRVLVRPGLDDHVAGGVHRRLGARPGRQRGLHRVGDAPLVRMHAGQVEQIHDLPLGSIVRVRPRLARDGASPRTARPTAGPARASRRLRPRSLRAGRARRLR